MTHSKLKFLSSVVCLLLLTGSLTGCFDEDLGPPTYHGPAELQFFNGQTSSSSARVFDGSGILPIRVQLIAESGTLPDDHQYGVTVVDGQSNVSADNYELLTPSPTLSADSVFSEVRVDVKPGSIPPGETRTLTLQLQPSEDGEVEVAENFKYYTVTIVGQQARISTSAASIDFGEVPVGTSVTDTVTISNICGTSSCQGTLPTDLSNLQITGDGADVFDIVSPEGATSTLAPNASQDVIVEFTPDAFQTYSDTLSLQSTNAPGGALTTSVTLTGTGVSDPMDTSFGGFDADASGDLSADEFDEVLRRSGSFGTFDANGDASVDSTEFTTGLFGAFDADGDNNLDPSEFNAGSDAFFGSGTSATFGDFDSDGDGVLTMSEFGAGMSASGEDVFASFDGDSSGDLTAGEFNAGLFGLADPDVSGGIDEMEFGDFTPFLGL